MIVVAEYDPSWPLRFEQLRQEYARAMLAAGVPVIAVEHIRSTSAPAWQLVIVFCDIHGAATLPCRQPGRDVADLDPPPPDRGSCGPSCPGRR